MASPVRLRANFRALGCEVIELFSEVDGDFPNHHPDPGKPENLQDLIRACNTTPVLVLRFEDHTEAALHRIEAEMLALLLEVKPDAQLGASAH